ncbi:FUSC family protein [Alicyclobacillus pomorum]|uniref:FUSC family protein n=1 Tax=Alicyclobacillus pomorum TaxID=204470 RepID=UPI0004008725|nr:aromatic acid exporter family protein [Alicyclobacillus pomorum]
MGHSIWKWFINISPIWKTALAAGVAWEVAQWTGSERPYFAPLAAILCLQVTVEESIWRGYQRVIGIVVGVLLATGIVRWIGLHGWSIALIVLIGTGLATWLRLGSQAIPQVGVSAMMVMTVGGHHYTYYAYERVVDTVLGAVIAVLVNMFIVPPDYTPTARAAVTQAGERLASRFREMGEWALQGADLSAGVKLQKETRGYIEELHRASDDVQKAIRAVRFSPLVVHRSNILMKLEKDLFHLRQGYAHAAGLLRTLMEWKESGALGDDALRGWGQRMMDVGHVVSAWSQTVSGLDTRTEAETADAAATSMKESLGDIYAYEAALWNDLRQVMHDFRVIE